MKLDVAHIAKLANLTLNKEELKKFESQLSETLSYIEELNEINTENTSPTSQVTGLKNIVREDIASSSFSQEEALQNSKSTHNGLFKVKAILDE